MSFVRIAQGKKNKKESDLLFCGYIRTKNTTSGGRNLDVKKRNFALTFLESFGIITEPSARRHDKAHKQKDFCEN